MPTVVSRQGRHCGMFAAFPIDKPNHSRQGCLAGMKRREFLGAIGIAVAAGSTRALAQTRGRPLAPGEVRAPGRGAAPPAPVRKATITKLFKSPDGHPNALDASPEGLSIGEQVTDRAILMDLNGKVLRAIETECHNCSGIAVGGGSLWMSANGAQQFDRPVKIDRTNQEILQCDMNGKVVKRHDVPIGGGSATGIEYVDGTLWMVAGRLRALMQVDAQTFQPIIAHPFQQMARPHGLAWDNGAMWVVDGDDTARIVKMDAKTGSTLEIIQIAPGDPDPHGLTMLGGKHYYCDAGIHPGWDRDKSPHTGWICRVDL